MDIKKHLSNIARALFSRPIQTPPTTDAFKRGYLDGLNSTHANPHKTGSSNHDDWKAGHDRARAHLMW